VCTHLFRDRKKERRRNGGKEGGQKERAGHRWFTPVILAARECEIGRIMVQGQPEQIVL
jgi:hypothetical protein